jgi:hypothetical protein
LKTLLRFGHDLKAFARLSAFEHATAQVVELAKQNEGWLKSQSQGHGRNRPAMPEKQDWGAPARLPPPRARGWK